MKKFGRNYEFESDLGIKNILIEVRDSGILFDFIILKKRKSSVLLDILWKSIEEILFMPEVKYLRGKIAEFNSFKKIARMLQRSKEVFII